MKELREEVRVNIHLHMNVVRSRMRWRGHVDPWTRGHVDTWSRGHVDTWTCGHVDTWTRGHVDMWTRGHVQYTSEDESRKGCETTHKKTKAEVK